MRPTAPLDDVINHAGANAEFAGQLRRVGSDSFAARDVTLSNGEDFSGGESGVAVKFSRPGFGAIIAAAFVYHVVHVVSGSADEEMTRVYA